MNLAFNISVVGISEASFTNNKFKISKSLRQNTIDRFF